MKVEDMPALWRNKAWGAARKRVEQLRMDVHGGEMGEVIDAAIAAVAPLIAKAERERCAAVCDARYMGDNNREDQEAKRCAAAIRALD